MSSSQLIRSTGAKFMCVNIQKLIKCSLVSVKLFSSPRTRLEPPHLIKSSFLTSLLSWINSGVTGYWTAQPSTIIPETSRSSRSGLSRKHSRKALKEVLT